MNLPIPVQHLLQGHDHLLQKNMSPATCTRVVFKRAGPDKSLARAGAWVSGEQLARQFNREQTQSEEQSSGRTAAHQCVRAPQVDVIGIPRAEDGHYGDLSLSDDRIKKYGGLLYLIIIAV